MTEHLGFQIGDERAYGVGMFFFPQDELIRSQAMKMFEIIVRKEGMTFLGWREVPTAPEILGRKAVDVMPYIAQGFVGKPAGMKAGLDFDRKLYIARRVFEQSNEDTYVVSLSSRTIVYKGMFLVGELRLFFRISRMKIISQPLLLYIPDSAPTPIPAGCGPIPTALLSTTVKSIPSAAMWIRWWPGRRTWNPSISDTTCTRCCPL